MKRIINLLSILTMYTVSLLVMSCSDMQDVEHSTLGRQAISSLNTNIGELFTKSIFANNSNTRANVSMTKEGDKYINISFPGDTKPTVRDLYNYVYNFNDLCALHDLTAAELYVSPKPKSEYSIAVSSSKINEILSPMVKESINFLKSLDFSDTEIENMLQENNADKTALIPLVLLISEDMTDSYAFKSHKMSSILDIFATKAYADNSINWNVVESCAIEAIGADVFMCAGQSTAKYWTKAVIKKTFKTIAKKALGPVGVCIAVAEFSYCLHKSHNCSYYHLPNSPIYAKYQKLNIE